MYTLGGTMRLFALSALLLFSTYIWADLLVYPTRAVISQRQRVVNLTLRNTGTKPETYKMSLVFYRMAPKGSLELVENPKPEERSAVKLLRFSPRRTTLTPNLEQVVRVMLGGVGNLAEGDYRAHIHFEPTDAPDEGEPSREVTARNESGISMKLQAKVAVAVPIIYRQGNPKAEVQLARPRLVPAADKKEKAVAFQMMTKGTGFPYGDFLVTFVPKGGDPVTVGELNGVSSYLPDREVVVNLTAPKEVKLSKGILKVEFREAERKESTPLAMVETTI